MIGKVLRAFMSAGPQPGEASSDPSGRPRYHWRCECGAHSRGPGDWFANRAEYNAQQHQWREGVGHPMPEVYPTESV